MRFMHNKQICCAWMQGKDDTFCLYAVGKTPLEGDSLSGEQFPQHSDKKQNAEYQKHQIDAEAALQGC